MLYFGSDMFTLGHWIFSKQKEYDSKRHMKVVYRKWYESMMKEQRIGLQGPEIMMKKNRNECKGDVRVTQ